jgi:RNA polymerase sigma factor (sigma-70 family)
VRGLTGQVSATARPLSASILKPLARESDLRLVELSRTGDERAFEALVRRHRHELHVYAARLMGAEGRGEDALQHALMSAWVALRDRGAEVANPRAWLYGIVHNSAVSVLRRARHDTVELNEALEAPQTYAGPDTHVIVSEIFAGLAQMPAPQRHALLMTAVAGASHGEAASALGVSDGAVRGMVYRARAALRQAAAAVLPPGLVNWAIGLGHRRPRLPVDPADAAAATSASAGVAAAVVKGGAVIAAVGALAGAAGPALLPSAPGRPHHRPVAVHQSAPTRRGSSGLPGRLVLAPGVNAHQPGLAPHHALTAIASTETEHSDFQARGHDDGRGSPGEGFEHGDRSGSGSSSGSGRGDTGSSNGDSSGDGSSGSGSSGGGSSGGGSSGSGSSKGDSSGSGSSGSGRGNTTSSGSGSSGSSRGDTGTPSTASGSSATPSASTSSSSSSSGGPAPGPSEANQSSGDAGPAAAPATSPAGASGGGDSSAHGGGADGGHSGSSG